MAESHRLRVLLVEDSEDDAQLVVRELERFFDDVAWERVETALAMRAALGRQSWDLILADFNLPQFSAPEALRVLQETGLDLPFLIVSGSVGEEIAVESMRAGAHDFLLKGSFKRLMPAIERELGQAGQRRARRQAEEQNRLLAAIVESSDDAIVSTDLSGKIMTWNHGAERMYGYGAAEMKGRPISLLEPGERRGEVSALLECLPAGKGVHRYETVRIQKDGTPIEVAVSLFPIPSASGGIAGAASIARDITDKRKAEEALHASEERYRLLFESNPQPMWVFDETTLAFLAVNEAACRRYGYTREEFLVLTIRDIRPEEDILALQRQIASEPREYQDSGTWRHRKKDGTVIEVEITSHPLRFDGREAQLVLAIDVTERRQLEAQLRQSQKMEAVGTLAGGIAHDFNNLLTTVLGYTELVLDQLGADSPLRDEVAQIQKAGERAATLTRQLLAFSRKQVLAPVVLDLNVVVADLEKMLRRLIGEDVDLMATLAPEIWNVRADPGQIEQVIVNLVVNARDAMPRGGKITIETRNCDLDDSYVRSHRYAVPGEHVCLSVSDTGLGMDAQTRGRIFEPFFTTKGPGKGTGLGLSTVYGIVKQSGGSIEVYSEPGRGSSFKIYLPRAAAAEAPVPPQPTLAPAGGSETVLVVEDEEAVRRLARVVLEKMGYEVLEAASAEEAQSLMAGRVGEIDLLLTDSIMPGVSGPDLAQRLRSEHPRLKVLFMSGYTDDAVVRQGLIGATEAFLQKPFTPPTLARKVREVLDFGG